MGNMHLENTGTVLSVSMEERELTSISVSSAAADVLLPYTMPEAEYMYGCSATAIGMLLGYYDLYGYTENGITYDFSNLIEGNISVDSRGSDNGSIYDMKDPSLLANFIASAGYLDRFYGQSASHEKGYSFINGDPDQGLNIAAWDCLADYLGTGQYWRSNDDLSTTHYLATLDHLRTTSQTTTISGERMPIKYIDFKYGLSLYTASRGYTLDAASTASISVDNFTFEDFMDEIDSGRSVLISMNSPGGGHMVVAYGYNINTREIIFDDTYRSDCRMRWNGTYEYSNDTYSISSVTTVVFDTSNLTAAFTPGEWLTDYETALQWAAAKQVPILVYYGDRATCGFCKNLEDEIFDTDEFRQYTLSSSVILLKNTRVPGISYGGTPSCFLLAPDGTLLSSKNGYGAGAKEEWLAWFTSYVELAGSIQTADIAISSPVIAVTAGATGSSAEIHSSDRIYLSLDITNSGELPVGRSFKLQIKVDGNIVTTVDVQPLAVGETRRIRDIEIGSRGSGTHSYEILADSENVVLERKESNNVLSGTFFVQYGDDLRVVSSTEKLTNTTSSNLLVISRGQVLVSSGGLMRDSIIDGGGARVYSRGSARNVSVANGYMIFSQGASAANLTFQSAGSGHLFAGTISGVTISSGGQLFISSGGTVRDAENAGGLFLTNGTISGAHVYSGGYLRGYFHHSNLAFSDIVIHSGGTLDNYYCDITGAGTMHNITVHAGGDAMLIGRISGEIIVAGQISIGSSHTSFDSGTKFKLDISQRLPDESLYFDFHSGLNNCELSLVISEEQTAGSYRLMYAADDFNNSFSICSDTGVCYTTQTLSTDSVARVGDLTFELEKDHWLTANVYKAGIYCSGTVLSSGVHTIKYGMEALDTTVLSGATVYLRTDGIARDLRLSQDGRLYVSSGGTASGTVISGSAGISSGNTGQRVFFDWGYAALSSGGQMSATTVLDGGWLRISSGGSANGLTLQSAGSCYISAGGTLTSGLVESGGFLYASDGSISGLDITSGGSANLYAGNVAGKINLGGYLYLYSGTNLQNTELNFDLTERNASGTTLLNNQSGSSFGAYSITVKADSAPGQYTLSYGENFSGKQITIRQGNTILGTVSTENALTKNGTTYSLLQSNSYLYFSIENETLANRADLALLSPFVLCGTDGNTALQDNSNITLTFSVANTGAVHAGAQTAAIYVDGSKVTDLSIAAINAGSCANYNCSLSQLTAGQHQIKVVLDTADKIAEQDEVNNTYTQTVFVSSAALPAPSGVWLNSSSLGSRVSAQTVTSGQSMYVFSGGTVESAMIASRGSAFISSGGVVRQLELQHSSARVSVGFGGTVSQAVLSGGGLTISSGATVSSLVQQSGTVYLQGNLSGARVSGGSLRLSSGARTVSTLLIGSGYEDVFANAVTEKAVISSGGRILLAGGSALETEVYSAGSLSVRAHSGLFSYASNARIHSAGFMDVYDSSLAENTVIHEAGYVRVRDYGSALNTKIEYGASMYVHGTSGYAYDTLVSGFARVYDGAVMSNTTIASGGSFHLWRGGYLKDVQVLSGGLLDLREQTPILQGTVTVRGELRASYAGTIVEDAEITLDLSDHTAESGYLITGYNKLNCGFSITVAADQAEGTYKLLNNVTNFDLNISIGNGATDYGTLNTTGRTVTYGGKEFALVRQDSAVLLEVKGSGSTPPTPPAPPAPQEKPVNIYSAGKLVSSAAVISGAAIGSNTSMLANSGGSALQTTVTSGGKMFASAGAVIAGLNVNSGGSAVFHSGAVLSGSHTYAGNIILSGAVNASGAQVNLDISRNFTASGIIVNDLALLAAMSYTITVSASQNYGTYQIANGAAGFNQTITICTTGGVCYSTLSLDNPVCDAAAARCYGLSVSGGILLLSITSSAGTQPPVVSSGKVNVFSGGTLLSGGNTLSGAAIGSNTSMLASSGGSALQTTVTSGGKMFAYNGAEISGLNVSSGGSAVFRTGAVLTGSHTYAGNIVLSGAVNASEAQVNFDISHNTTAARIIVNDLALLAAKSYTITVSASQNYGTYQIANGAAEFNQTITICTTAGVCYNNLTLNNSVCDAAAARCYGLSVSSGTLLLSITSSAGQPVVSAGQVKVYSGTRLVSSAAMISGTVLYSGGCNSMVITSGGTAQATILSSGGVMRVSSGGLADGAVIESRGTVYVSNGGRMTETLVGSAGGLHIKSGGTVDTLGIASGATVHASSGSVLSGTIRAEGKLNISGTVQAAAAEIVFDLTNRTASSPILISNPGGLSGAAYSITVAADQAAGVYQLADKAGGFTGSITVRSGAEEWGTLSADGTGFCKDGKCYSLAVSDALLTLTVNAAEITPLQSSPSGIAWTPVTGTEKYTVSYSADRFGHGLTIETSGSAVDTYGLPAGTYQWQVCADGVCHPGNDVVSTPAAEPQKFISDADGNLDLFFGNANGIWESGYAAEHQGVLNGWTGTAEQVVLDGKNKVADVFSGSSDANILVLTDDTNGDALFVDDVFTAFGKDAARLSQIDEIRAGAGDDIVDMTSQQFACSGDGVKIYGGNGDDTIWANNGSNTLFGDAGNDRIVGGSGNDVIVGGSGDDLLHGGGGSDIFCFGGNWGNDTVQQLDSSSVTLWFESGSESNWNAATLTYSDGSNSVTVSGVSNVTLKFGTDASLPDGAFADAASEKIFEDKSKGMIA